MSYFLREFRYWLGAAAQTALLLLLIIKFPYLTALFVALFVTWAFCCPEEFLKLSRTIKRYFVRRERARYTSEEWEEIKERFPSLD